MYRISSDFRVFNMNITTRAQKGSQSGRWTASIPKYSKMY